MLLYCQIVRSFPETTEPRITIQRIWGQITVRKWRLNGNMHRALVWAPLMLHVFLGANLQNCSLLRATFIMVYVLAFKILQSLNSPNNTSNSDSNRKLLRQRGMLVPPRFLAMLVLIEKNFRKWQVKEKNNIGIFWILVSNFSFHDMLLLISTFLSLLLQSNRRNYFSSQRWDTLIFWLLICSFSFQNMPF